MKKKIVSFSLLLAILLGSAEVFAQGRERKPRPDKDKKVERKDNIPAPPKPVVVAPPPPPRTVVLKNPNIPPPPPPAPTRPPVKSK